MRGCRIALGVVLVLAGLLVLAGGGMAWWGAHRQERTGGFGTDTQRLATPGYAIVVPDLDALLDAGAPYAALASSTVRVSAVSADRRRLFLGLAPAERLTGYLGRSPRIEVTGVAPESRTRLDTREVPGDSAPGPPARRSIWWVRATGGPGGVTLSWRPGDYAGRGAALVVMNADAGAPLDVRVTAAAALPWLARLAWTLVVLGAVLAAVGIAVLVLARRSRRRAHVSLGRY